MTNVVKDTIKDVTMTIGGDDWLVSEAVVELSQNTTPNYVDINKMVPGYDTDVPKTRELIDEPFELRVDNQIISKRDTDAEEDTLLFKGNLANISPTGVGSYEGVAYDPSQEGFDAQNGTSLLNQEITLYSPYYGSELMRLKKGIDYEPRTKKASTFVSTIVDFMGLDSDEVDIQLKKDGVERTGERGSVTGAYDLDISFDEQQIVVEEALNRIAEKTDSTYWFDKSGTFHFGVPESTKHLLHFITEASDGMTTGPYQSVRIIGSGVSSKEGEARQSMNAEERIIEEWIIGRELGGTGLTAKPLEEASNVDKLPEPVFEYRNAEISTDGQAKNTAKKLTKEIAKQQASGKITVTGFPEVEPLDSVKLPQAQDESKENYYPNQPMEGSAYQVYKVKHKLNSSDGFKTEIHVAGLVGSARVVLFSEQTERLLDRAERFDASSDTQGPL